MAYPFVVSGSQSHICMATGKCIERDFLTPQLVRCLPACVLSAPWRQANASKGHKIIKTTYHFSVAIPQFRMQCFVQSSLVVICTIRLLMQICANAWRCTITSTVTSTPRSCIWVRWCRRGRWSRVRSRPVADETSRTHNATTTRQIYVNHCDFLPILTRNSRILAYFTVLHVYKPKCASHSDWQ